MTNKKIIIILSCGITFLGLFVFLGFRWYCPFKSITNIPCPGCGMTRAFIALLHFEFMKALYYNFLSYFIIIVIILSYILYFIDLFRSGNILTHFYKIMLKYKVIIFVLIFIAWIVNIYHNL
mgnify:FL=1